jgi:hypothetical protein
MKNTLILLIITVASISSLFVNTAYAVVICVDKNNPTKVLVCSDPNAIDKNTIKTSPTAITANTAAILNHVFVFSIAKSKFIS